MADPDSYPVRLKRGVAQFAADHGLGVYRPTGPAYSNPERGVFTNGPELPTTIDNCIVLTALSPTFDGRASVITPIQFRYRVAGSVIDAENLGQRIISTFDLLERTVFGGVLIGLVEYRNALAFTPDSISRPGGTVTFYFHGRRNS
ncbi:hypothetical protein [Kitasatospora herbaricolor]|uniref:hypothetical protein n=1 Tax=Kitasatospora herbaricolor TaxID=68217 RepID=UPI0036DDDDEB